MRFTSIYKRQRSLSFLEKKLTPAGLVNKAMGDLTQNNTEDRQQLTHQFAFPNVLHSLSAVGTIQAGQDEGFKNTNQHTILQAKNYISSRISRMTPQDKLA